MAQVVQPDGRIDTGLLARRLPDEIPEPLTREVPVGVADPLLPRAVESRGSSLGSVRCERQSAMHAAAAAGRVAAEAAAPVGPAVPIRLGRPQRRDIDERRPPQLRSKEVLIGEDQVVRSETVGFGVLPQRREQQAAQLEPP